MRNLKISGSVVRPAGVALVVALALAGLVSAGFGSSIESSRQASGQTFELADGKQPLWSYDTGGRVWPVSISSDGRYIAAGSDDYLVYLFSRDSSEPLWSYRTGYWVWSVSISSDGGYIAAGSDDYLVYLFSVVKVFPPMNWPLIGEIIAVLAVIGGLCGAPQAKTHAIMLENLILPLSWY